VLFVSTCFVTYPAWNLKFKQNISFAIFWNLGLIFCLVGVNSILLMISNFNQPMLMTIILANLIILAMLVRWQVAILMMLIGIFASIELHQYYSGLPFSLNDMNRQFQILYPLVFVSSFLLAFLKPKQEYQALTEDKNKYLNSLMGAQEQRVKEALLIRSTFIRNINHEYNAPMSGITTMAQILAESYDMLTDTQRRDAAQSIFKSVTRLDMFDANLSSLSALSRTDVSLNIEEIDLSSLVYDRINICRKLFEENKEDREFILNIENGVMLNGDKGYIAQMLDNLIINAITYCRRGKIEISLNKGLNSINFSISDEGVGVPTEELYDIFDEFTVSSKTRTLAGGRGIGLSLCKKILELHRGSIKASSDGKSGATFQFTIPIE
jgi:signal transduction histidine kinase